MGEDLLSKIIDKVFSLRKSTICLAIIFLIGFILRLIAALNVGVYGDDMHFVTHAINFISAGRLETYDQSSGLWFAFTDIMYHIFGATQLASRMAALVFGSLSILAIYLLSKEFFSERVALISAFLLAFSPFHIRYTTAEMDIMAMFFVIFGMYSFVKGVKSDKMRMFAVSGVLFGLAIYTKVYPLLFIPSMILFFAFKNYKKDKKIIRKGYLGKIGLFTIPVLTHNYLLYQDKGFLDLQFTRSTGLGKNVSAQYYSWDAQFDAKNSWAGLVFGDTKHIASGIPLLLGAVGFVRTGDPIVFYLGILGILLILFKKKEHKEYLLFLFLSILFALPFLASIILLSKHFMFIDLFVIPAAAFFIVWGNDKIKEKTNKNFMKLIVMIILIISLFFLGKAGMSTPIQFYSESSTGQIIDFRESSIPVGSLVIADSRFYRGRIHWFSQGRVYLEGSEFMQIANDENVVGNLVSVDAYYIECIPDDCGWGTVKDQPEFNASMELLTNFFKENGKIVKTIYEPEKDKDYYPFLAKSKKMATVNIYNAKIRVVEGVMGYARQPKSWFLYNMGYFPVESNFDYYITYNAIDKFLNSLAHWLVFLSVALALISPIYLIRLLIKDENIYNSSGLQRREDHRESP